MMSLFTKIAWRNIGRRPNRSCLTIVTVSAGFACFLFFKSFADAAHSQLIASRTDLLAGHIQIHRTGFFNDPNLARSIPNPDSVLAAIKGTPGVKAAASRIKDHCFISSAEGSKGVLLYGVEPDAERRVSTLSQHLRKGRFFTNADADKIIIGTGLAEHLKADIGDQVVLMGQNADGNTVAAAFEVCGILNSGVTEIDHGFAAIPLKSAQEFLVMDEKISEIVVKTSSPENTDNTMALLLARLDPKRYEILSWEKVSPEILRLLQADRAFGVFVLLIVLAAIAAVILHTAQIGILERRREFGLMACLGTGTDHIASVVKTEASLLGLCGVLLGGFLSTGLILLFGIVGIDLSKISDALTGSSLGKAVYPRLDVHAMAAFAGVILLVIFCVSAYAAKSTLRVSPLEAAKTT